MRWELTASPGLALKVTDSHGRPLAGAAVKVESWSGPTPSGWRWQTDIQGRMTWDGAPISNALYSVTKSGFEPLTAQPFPSDARERLVKLRRILTVTGRVTDFATGQLLDHFLVVPGQVHDDHHHWDRTMALTAKRGLFTVTLPGPGLPHALKIEAEGYYPEVS